MQRYKDYLTFPNISTINLNTFSSFSTLNIRLNYCNNYAILNKLSGITSTKTSSFSGVSASSARNLHLLEWTRYAKKKSGYLTTTRFQTPKQTMKNFEKIKLCISLSQRYFEKSPFVNISVPIEFYCSRCKYNTLFFNLQEFLYLF